MPVRSHPQRAEIELTRIAGGTLQEVADRFGIPRSSLHRHMTTMSFEEHARLKAVAVALAEEHAALIRMAALTIQAATNDSLSYGHGAG
ncbi:helix-turn-helix domain-containing protein [Methylorubrum podarium]|uniref:Helix-turn-helix domain-containing protein n=1 Tax=Methylorubrum podarium TaxID=200476 RepID=A0ABV1QMS0_9HYPH